MARGVGLACVGFGLVLARSVVGFTLSGWSPRLLSLGDLVRVWSAAFVCVACGVSLLRCPLLWSCGRRLLTWFQVRVFGVWLLRFGDRFRAVCGALCVLGSGSWCGSWGVVCVCVCVVDFAALIHGEK